MPSKSNHAPGTVPRFVPLEPPPPKICILLYLECMYLAWILYNSAELTFFFLSFFLFLERALAQHVLELETELEHKAVQYCKMDGKSVWRKNAP